MLYKINGMDLVPSTGGQINDHQNDQQSGSLMGKFARSHGSVETRGRYYWEIILHGLLIILHILWIQALTTFSGENNGSPKIPIFRTCQSVTLHAKGLCRLLLRILRWWDYPGLFGRAQCHQKGPYKGERETGGSEEIDNGSRNSCDFAMGQGMWAVSRPWKRQGSHPELPEGMQAFYYPFWTSELLDNKCVVLSHYICGYLLQQQ